MREFLNNDCNEKLDPGAATAEPVASTNVELDDESKKKATLEDFLLLKVIGKGSFGKVMLAKHKHTGKVYAVKVISKKAIKQRDEVKHIMAERNVLMQNVKHPFLVGLRYSFQTPVRRCFSFFWLFLFANAVVCRRKSSTLYWTMSMVVSYSSTCSATSASRSSGHASTRPRSCRRSSTCTRWTSSTGLSRFAPFAAADRPATLGI